MKRHIALLWLLAFGGLIIVSLMSGCAKKTTQTAYTEPVVTAAADEGMDRYTVGMAGSQFRPQTMTAPPGQAIVFLNNCTKVHTLTPDAGTLGPNSDLNFPDGLQPGQTYQWTIPADTPVGTTYYYHCRFHGTAGNGESLGSGMAGAVVVAAAGTPPATTTDVVPGTATTPGASTGTGATGTTRSTGAGTAGTNRGTAPGATTSSGTGGTGNAGTQTGTAPGGY
jgi:plastocyanin